MICRLILTLFIASNSLAENLYSLLARTIIGILFATRDFGKSRLEIYNFNLKVYVDSYTELN